MIIKPHQLGLVIGGIFAAGHLIWSTFVAIGFGQPFLDFVFTLHRISPPYHVLPFDLGLAIGLVLFTGALGFAMGYLVALLWNAVVKK